MGNVADYAKKYMDEGYTCAESTLLAANEAWDLNIPENSSNFLAGFGGGMMYGDVCGAVSGGVAALSYKYVHGDGHHSPLLTQKVSTFVQLVEKRIGTKLCRELRPMFMPKGERCIATVLTITKILDEVESMEFDEPEHSAEDIRFTEKGQELLRNANVYSTES